MKKFLISLLTIAMFASVFSGCGSKGQIKTAQTEEQSPNEFVTQNFNSFEATTLDGESVDNSIFEDYNLTMINIWATWCGPCVGELPELAKLHKELPQNVNLIGICTDSADETDMAKNILEVAGVEYTVLSDNESLQKCATGAIQSLPTTLFVDSNGNIVGEPVLGAPTGDVAQQYLDIININLKLLGNN